MGPPIPFTHFLTEEEAVKGLRGRPTYYWTEGKRLEFRTSKGKQAVLRVGTPNTTSLDVRSKWKWGNPGKD